MTVTEYQYKNTVSIVGVKMPKKYTAVFSLSGEDGKSYKEIVLIWQKINIKKYISPKP